MKNSEKASDVLIKEESEKIGDILEEERQIKNE